MLLIKKLLLCIIILISVTLISCKKDSYSYPDNNYYSFLTKLENYNKDKINNDLLQKYYESYKVTNNINEAINHINHPTFLNAYSFTDKAITIDDILLVNTNYLLEKDYLPINLVEVSSEYCIYKANNKQYLDSVAYSNLIKLLKDAKTFGYNIKVYSSYRDYDYQASLYNSSNNKKYVAKPGRSEHQTGLSVDVALEKSGLTSHFDGSVEDLYLQNNAYKYGFIQRYGKGMESITGYPYESWHYRYIGEKHAKIIHDEKLSLEEYLYKYYLI